MDSCYALKSTSPLRSVVSLRRESFSVATSSKEKVRKCASRLRPHVLPRFTKENEKMRPSSSSSLGPSSCAHSSPCFALLRRHRHAPTPIRTTSCPLHGSCVRRTPRRWPRQPLLREVRSPAGFMRGGQPSYPMPVQLPMKDGFRNRHTSDMKQPVLGNTRERPTDSDEPVLLRSFDTAWVLRFRVHTLY